MRPVRHDRVRVTKGRHAGRIGYIAADNWLWYVVVFTDHGFEHQEIKPIWHTRVQRMSEM